MRFAASFVSPSASALLRPLSTVVLHKREPISLIDQMMQTLKLSGKLKKVKAIIIGDFTYIKLEKRWGKSVLDLLKEYTKDLDIRVIYKFPAGHKQVNNPLFFGRRVSLEVDNLGSKITFN